jgi:tyrosinase
VLEIENQLNYTYSGLPSAPPPAPALLGEEVGPTPDEQPAEKVGATDEPVLLAGAQSAETSFQVSAPTGPVAQMLSDEAREPRTYLNVEVEGEKNPGLVYGVYVNLPPGEPAEQESPHYVGALPFFGIETTVPEEAEEEAPHRLRYVFDITPTVAELTAKGHWNPDELHVTFAPVVGPDTRPGLLGEAEAEPSPVHVTHVSLFVE